MSNSRKGKPSGTLGKPAWNKGIATGKLSEEAKSKLREARNGRPAWNKGLKTGPSKKRGTKLSDEIKAKISNSKKKKTQEVNIQTNNNK